MRTHRFFVDLVGGGLPPKGKVKIDGMESPANEALVHQWRHVLRFQVGQEVILFDNSGSEFHAVINALTGTKAEVEILGNRTAAFVPARPLSLYIGLPKRPAFEWALEKGTELGVTGFVPVVTEHSEKKKVNMERSRTILREASEQSHRSIVPDIFEPKYLTDILDTLAENDLSGMNGAATFSFALDPGGMPLKKLFEDFPLGGRERLNIFIGPEGGFSPRELDLFKQHDLPVFSLGKQVLRAETAALAAAAIFLLGK